MTRIHDELQELEGNPYHEECPSCLGTGIGHPGADTPCGDCRGRGYTINREDEPDGDDYAPGLDCEYEL